MHPVSPPSGHGSRWCTRMPTTCQYQTPPQRQLTPAWESGGHFRTSAKHTIILVADENAQRSCLGDYSCRPANIHEHHARRSPETEHVATRPPKNSSRLFHEPEREAVGVGVHRGRTSIRQQHRHGVYVHALGTSPLRWPPMSVCTSRQAHRALGLCVKPDLDLYISQPGGRVTSALIGCSGAQRSGLVCTESAD
ncbi:hypothetical protein BC628DRAFT_861489 [Trametes gibbosa]|nr:hypothetical protein BC628DRAFT_861489 [Trametes gibbosa]